MDHPDLGTLAAHLDGRLPGPEADAVREHLLACRPRASAVAEAMAQLRYLATAAVRQDLRRRASQELEGLARP